MMQKQQPVPVSDNPDYLVFVVRLYTCYDFKNYLLNMHAAILQT